MEPPRGLVEHRLGHLVRQLGDEIPKASEAKRMKELLQVSRALQVGRMSTETVGVEDCPEINTSIKGLVDLGGDWSALFNSKRLGLYLCLGEVLLNYVGPNWLAVLSHSEKEALFYRYFDNGPKTQLLKFLIGKSKDGQRAEPDGKVLAREVAKISRETACSLLERIFLRTTGVPMLLDELRTSPTSGAKEAKELAALMASIPDRVKGMSQDRCVSALFTHALEAASAFEEEGNQQSYVFLAGLTKGFCRRGYARAVGQSIHDFMHRKRESVHEYKNITVWDNTLPHVKDLYALEHLFYSIVLIETKRAGSTSEGMGKTLRACFGGSLGILADLRIILLDRILLKRMLPLESIRLVLNLVARGASEVDKADKMGFLSIEEVVFRLSVAWSKEDSFALLSVGQQATLSVAIIQGLGLTMRDKLESDFPSVPKILEGISSRLGSVNASVRNHAMAVAKALSLTLDASNPLSFDVQVDFEKALTRDLERATGDVTTPDDSIDGGGEGEGEGKYASEAVRDDSHVRDIHATVSYGTNCLAEECDLLTLSDESSEESDSDDESSLEAYDMSEDENDANARLPKTLGAFVKALRKPDDHETFEFVLTHCERMISQVDRSITPHLVDLTRALLYANVPEDFMSAGDKGGPVSPVECKLKGLVAVLVKAPVEASRVLISDFYSVHLGVSQRLMILDALQQSAARLSKRTPPGAAPSPFAPPMSPEDDLDAEERAWESRGPKTTVFAPVSLSKGGKGPAIVKNDFLVAAHSFMLPLLSKYDHKGEGLDMVDRDFVLLGKVLQTSCVFLDCAGKSQEGIELSFILFEFLEATRVMHHEDALVRKSSIECVRWIVRTIPGFLITAYDDGRGGLSFESLQEVLVAKARHDADEECRILSAQALRELERAFKGVAPAIEILG